MNNMELKVFKDDAKFEEWINLAVYSQFDENTFDEKIIVSDQFRCEMMDAFIKTKQIKDDFKFSHEHPIMFSLMENQEIVGTVCIRQDEHKSFAGQLRNVAIKKEFRRNGLGKFMIEECEKIIHQHSNYKYLTLTTGSSHGFYEKIGLKLAGILNFDGIQRYFFYKKINEIN